MNTKSKLKRAMGRDAHVTRLIIIMIIVFAFFSLIKPSSFLKTQTFHSMFVQFPEFGLMALGVMLCMITGGIDLSVVGTANMASLAAALTLIEVLPQDVTGTAAIGGILITIAVALVIGLGAGILNGILVSYLKIPPILATLGTLELYTGIAIVLTRGKPVSGLPIAYSETVAGNIGGVIPVPLIIFIVAAIIVAFLLSKTSFGTKIYMLGTNPTAGTFSGLRTNKLLIQTYMISGLMSALGGLVMMANYNSAKADYGAAYTLQTILIVVLGGVNPDGGKGQVSGVVLAILVLQMLSSGLNMFPQISNFYRHLIWGGVLLAVMVANYFIERQPRKRTQAKEKNA